MRRLSTRQRLSCARAASPRPSFRTISWAPFKRWVRHHTPACGGPLLHALASLTSRHRVGRLACSPAWPAFPGATLRKLRPMKLQALSTLAALMITGALGVAHAQTAGTAAAVDDTNHTSTT